MDNLAYLLHDVLNDHIDVFGGVPALFAQDSVAQAYLLGYILFPQAPPLVTFGCLCLHEGPRGAQFAAGVNHILGIAHGGDPSTTMAHRGLRWIRLAFSAALA